MRTPAHMLCRGGEALQRQDVLRRLEDPLRDVILQLLVPSRSNRARDRRNLTRTNRIQKATLEQDVQVRMCVQGEPHSPLPGA